MLEIIKAILPVIVSGTILLTVIAIVALTKLETDIVNLVAVFSVAIAIIVAVSTGRGVSVRRRDLDGAETSAHIGSEQAKP